MAQAGDAVLNLTLATTCCTSEIDGELLATVARRSHVEAKNERNCRVALDLSVAVKANPCFGPRQFERDAGAACWTLNAESKRLLVVGEPDFGEMVRQAAGHGRLR